MTYDDNRANTARPLRRELLGRHGKWLIILPPLLFLLVFFLIPFGFALSISFADTAKSPPVAIVNQEFARRLFHAEHVIGRYFKTFSGQPIQIVGVVANGKYGTLNEDPQPAIFFPIAQEGNTSTTLVVRTHPDPTGATGREMAAAIRKTILDLDPAIPIQESSVWSRGTQ